MFPLRLRLTGGIVPRELSVAAGAAGDVEVDAIPLSSDFDLKFYRQLVRNGFDAPKHLEALRRWKIDPRNYLRTVDDAGTAIDQKTLDSTEATIRETIPMWTAGTLKAYTIERGTEDRVTWDRLNNGALAERRRPRGHLWIRGCRPPGRRSGCITSRRAAVAQPARRCALAPCGMKLAMPWASGIPTRRPISWPASASPGVTSGRRRASWRTPRLPITGPSENVDPDTDPNSVLSASVSPARVVP